MSLALGVEKLGFSWFMISDKVNVFEVVIKPCHHFCKTDFKQKKLKVDCFKEFYIIIVVTYCLKWRCLSYLNVIWSNLMNGDRNRDEQMVIKVHYKDMCKDTNHILAFGNML